MSGRNGTGRKKGSTAGAPDASAPASAQPPVVMPSQPGAAGAGSPYADELTILATLTGSKRLSTFARAAHLAGLDSLLSGAGWSTVFAPSDRAFTEVPGTSVDELLADRGALVELVKRHVFPKRVTAPRPGTPMRITAVGGDALQLTAEEGGYRLGNARVVRTNIRASNGVIHIIDAVLASE